MPSRRRRDAGPDLCRRLRIRLRPIRKASDRVLQSQLRGPLRSVEVTRVKASSTSEPVSYPRPRFAIMTSLCPRRRRRPRLRRLDQPPDDQRMESGSSGVASISISPRSSSSRSPSVGALSRCGARTRSLSRSRSSSRPRSGPTSSLAAATFPTRGFGLRFIGPSRKFVSSLRKWRF